MNDTVMHFEVVSLCVCGDERPNTMYMHFLFSSNVMRVFCLLLLCFATDGTDLVPFYFLINFFFPVERSE